MILHLEAVAALDDTSDFVNDSKDDQRTRAPWASSYVSVDTIPVLWSFAWSIRRRDFRLFKKLLSLRNQQKEGSHKRYQRADDLEFDNDCKETTKECNTSLTDKNFRNGGKPSRSQHRRPKSHTKKKDSEPSLRKHARQTIRCIPSNALDNTGKEHAASYPDLKPTGVPNREECHQLIREVQETRGLTSSIRREYSVANARALRIQIACQTDGGTKFMQESRGMRSAKGVECDTEKEIQHCSKGLLTGRMK